MSDMTLAMLLMLKDMASGPLGKFSDKVKHTGAELIAAGAAAKAMGSQMMSAMNAPIKAFMEAEDASIRLKNAMSDKNGVARGFEEVNKLANQLGGDLPGNTADFQNLMAVLKDNGVAAQDLVNGVGKAAAYLGVQLKMPFEAAGEFAAKVGKAAGVAAKDMVRFMDVIQKTASMGVSASEMQYAFARAGGALAGAGLQGLKHAEGMSVIFASLVRGGDSGETIGTNMAAIISSLTDYNLGLTNKAKSAKQTLKSLGIELNLFQKGADGKQVLRGPREMVQELEKLNKLTDKQRGSVLKDMFGGGQDYQMIQKMLAMGVKGFDQIQAEQRNKLGLEEKIKAQLKSLANIKEAAEGAFTNMLAALGASIAPELKKLADGFGDLSAKIQSFAEKHPQLTKMAVGMTALSGGALVVGGSAVMGIGMMTTAFGSGASAVTKMGEGVGKMGLKAKDAATGLKAWNTTTGQIAVSAFNNAPSAIGNKLTRMHLQAALAFDVIKSKAASMGRGVITSVQGIPGAIKGLPELIKTKAAAMRQAAGASMAWFRSTFFTKAGLQGLANAGYAKIVTGFRAVSAGMRAMTIASLGNPLVWVAIAIVAAAVLIYKYWKPITAFFRGMWAGIKEGLAPLKTAFGAAFKPLAPILNPIMGALKAVWNWLKNLLKPVDDVGGKAEGMGKRFGKAIASIIQEGAKILGAFMKLPGELMKIGANMAQGLINGFKSIPVIGPVVSAVGGMIGAARKRADTHSPSREFMWIGAMMGEGLNVGMLSKTGQLSKAAAAVVKASIPKFPPIATPIQRVSRLPDLAVAGPGAMGRGALAGGPGGDNFVFAPVIQLQPGSPVESQVQQALQLSYGEFVRLIERYQHDRKRSNAG